MFLAAGGFRAVEALSIRIKDLDLESKPARVFVRGEYTKTKTDRVVFLTEEVTQQLRSWLSYKYRKRRVCYKGEKNNQIIIKRTRQSQNIEHQTEKKMTLYLLSIKIRECQILMEYMMILQSLLQRP